MNNHSSNFLLAFGYNIHNPISRVLKDSFGDWRCFFFEEEMDNGKVYSVFIMENELSNIPYPIVDILDDILDLKKIKFFVEFYEVMRDMDLDVSENMIQSHILSIN